MANKQSQEQKEYNSLLELTQSMLGKISNNMSEMGDQTDKRNKKLSEQISLTNEILKSVKTEKDLQAAISLIRENNKNISKEDFGVNNKYKETLLIQEQAISGVLKKHIQSKEILQKVSDKVDLVKEKFGAVFDNITDGLKQIPLIGNTLSSAFAPFAEKSKRMFNVVGEKFKSGFGNAFMKSTAQGNTFAQSVKAGIGGGFSSAMKIAGKFAKMLGPIGIAILVIAAGLAFGLKRFIELDAAAQSFRDTTNLLTSQTGDTARNIKEISVDFAQIGVSAEDVSKAAADFTNEFGGLEQPSKGVLSSLVALNKNFGIGTNEASKLNKVFQNIGGLSEEQSQYLIGQTVSMAKMAGVAPQKVIKDMADNSELAFRYFAGSPQELAKAAVQAAKLGTSLSEAGQVADNLLDFENSISAELEASAILGQSLNFGRARYLASTKKVIGAQQAVNDEVAKLGDISNLNTFQQDALTKATGMTYESLLNQQRIRERFGRLGEKDLASAMALMESGKALEDISARDLANQTQRMAKDEQRAGQMDKLSNVASALGTSFMDMLAPIADVLIPVLFDVTKFLGDILIPIFGLIGSILGIIGTVVMVVWNIAAAIVSGIITPIMSAFSLITDFFTQIDAQFAKILSYFDPIREFADNFSLPSLGSMFSSDDEMDKKTATTRATRASVTNSDFSNTTQAEKQTESISVNADDSVNDGVIQNGQVVSTHPEDFLIATKNPTGLAESMSGGVSSPMISMEGVIKELRELKAAFLSNKDVYMDSTKVTTIVRRKTETSTDNKFGTQFA